ncbi:hypothetical protein RIF29_40052 [Crotalaria pallida]|uniref:Uncharacterized protein n=1 Tax=Crotalaria pallida TaxID=3830 RepID=A0AAN9E4U9_CROPI
MIDKPLPVILWPLFGLPLTIVVLAIRLAVMTPCLGFRSGYHDINNPLCRVDPSPRMGITATTANEVPDKAHKVHPFDTFLRTIGDKRQHSRPAANRKTNKWSHSSYLNIQGNQNQITFSDACALHSLNETYHSYKPFSFTPFLFSHSSQFLKHTSPLFFRFSLTISLSR